MGSSMRVVVREGFLEERTGELCFPRDTGSQAVEGRVGWGMRRPECLDHRRSRWCSQRGMGPIQEGRGLRLNPEAAGSRELWAGQRHGQRGGLGRWPRLRIDVRLELGGHLEGGLGGRDVASAGALAARLGEADGQGHPGG